MLSPIIIAALMTAVKSLQSNLPQWQQSVDKWIDDDKDEFLRFKSDVFSTMKKNMHSLGSEGYEQITITKTI